MRHPRSRRTRGGTAVVAALALVVLSASLLGMAGAIASAGARAVLNERAALLADGAVRRAVALSLSEWDPRDDSLAIGATRVLALQAAVVSSVPSLPISGVRSVQRLGRTLFALSADVRIGTTPGLARRRVRLLVHRTVADSAAAISTTPIARWSSADLY